MATKAAIELIATDRTQQAFRSAEQAMGRMQNRADELGRVFSGLGGILSAGALVAFTRNAIGSAAALDDMAESTGASVEGLSKLVDIARIGGTDIGQVETALVRLTKALSGTDVESKGAGAAFAALGLSFRQLQSLAPDKALEEIARSLEKFGDGAGKTSAALAIFGKSGAELLPLLKDIGENLDRSSSLTAEQAAASERLEKSWRSLGVEASNLGRSLLTDLIPSIERFLSLVNEGGGGFGGALNAKIAQLTSGKSTIELIRKAEKDLEDLEKKMSEPGSMLQGGALGAAAGVRAAGLARMIESLKALQRQEALALGEGIYSNEARKPQLPFIPTESDPKKRGGRGGKADDPFKARDAAIMASFREAEAAAEAENLLLAQEKKALDESTAAWVKHAEQVLGLDQVTEEVVDNSKDRFAELTDAINGWSRDATKAFVDFAFGAEASLGDMLESIARQFAAMQLQKAVFDPLFSSLGGLLKSVLPFHSGGIVGAEGGAARSVSALAFAGAPRFHSGFMPDEYPAILKRGEGVFTPGQMRAMGGGSVSVNIRNEGTPQRVVSAQPTFDPSGMVVSIVTRDLALNGPISQAMGSQLGVRR